MIKSITMPRKEKGTVIVLTAVSLIVIMGMLGLAIDLGHAYVNKTRLQNALDAMALSAAISLVNERPLNQVVPDARNTFNEYGLASSIQATDIDTNDIDVCFFNNYSDITSASPCAVSTPTASSKFVRAAVKPGHLLSVATTFASFLGFTSTNIFASAVSGPVALNNLCDLIPIVACTTMTTTAPGPDGEAGTADDTRTPTDPNCDNDNDGVIEVGEDCYGYNVGGHYTLKLADWNSTNIASGNFGLLDVGSGGSDVCQFMAGNANCMSLDFTSPIPTQTGNMAGPTTCLNVRFDDHTHGNNLQQFPIPPYYPDTNIHEYPLGTSDTSSSQFANYKSHAGPPSLYPPSNTGAPDRRIVHVPLVDCNDAIGSHGSTVQLDTQAMGCFFLPKPVAYGGEPNQFEVPTEFVGVNKPGLSIDPKCEIDSKFLPTGTPSPFAPNRVVLFKDPVSGDA